MRQGIKVKTMTKVKLGKVNCHRRIRLSEEHGIFSRLLCFRDLGCIYDSHLLPFLEENGWTALEVMARLVFLPTKDFEICF